MSIVDRFELDLPLIQAPMAGVSTSLLAASVSEAGGLGSIGVGATDASGARAMIEELRGRTSRAFNVNLFVNRTAQADAGARPHGLRRSHPYSPIMGHSRRRAHLTRSPVRSHRARRFCRANLRGRLPTAGP